MPTITLYHPLDWTQGASPAEQRGRHARHPHIAAFGSSAQVAHVSGTLTLNQAGARPIPGNTRQQPPQDAAGNGFWIIEFDWGGAVQGSFTLRIVGFDAAGTQVCSHDEGNIIIDPSKHGFGMAYPTDGDTLCKQFAPYGTSDVAGAITATMSPLCGFSYSTVTYPPTTWVLSCTTTLRMPPAGTLKTNQGGTPQQASNLTVNPNC